MLCHVTLSALLGPSFGARESDDARMILGQPVKRGTLRRIVEDTNENRTRTYRRDVMRNARRTVAENVRNERNAEENAVAASPLESLRDDVHAGRVAGSSAVVTEENRVRDGNRNVYRTFTLEAMGYLVQLERLHSDYRNERRITDATMRHASYGGTRNARASVAGKRSRGTTTLYLTERDLERATDNASGDVEVMTENARGVTCVRYYRERGWAVNAAVKRHMRQAVTNA